MLEKTSSKDAPWTVINANSKKETHLNLIADLLSRVNYKGKEAKLLVVNPEIVMPCPPLGNKPPKVAP
jgi:hypothetical protein